MYTCIHIQFFGQQRHRGATSYNPNTQTFLQNTQALSVINTVAVQMLEETVEAGEKPYKKQTILPLLNDEESKFFTGFFQIQCSCTYYSTIVIIIFRVCFM